MSHRNCECRMLPNGQPIAFNWHFLGVSGAARRPHFPPIGVYSASPPYWNTKYATVGFVRPAQKKRTAPRLTFQGQHFQWLYESWQFQYNTTTELAEDNGWTRDVILRKLLPSSSSSSSSSSPSSSIFTKNQVFLPVLTLMLYILFTLKTSNTRQSR